MSEKPNVNNVYLSVACPRLIFILLDDRAAFDQIQADSHDAGDKGDKGHVIIKSVGAVGETIVVFQHWVRQPLLSSRIEQRLAGINAIATDNADAVREAEIEKFHS